MSTTSKNGATVPVGSDPYALTADLLAMMESAGLVYPVPDEATMLAIPSPDSGMVVLRQDVGAFMYYDGTGWKDSGITQTFSDVNTADANWSYAGGLYRDKGGSIVAGDRRVHLNLLLTRTGAAVNNVTTAYVQAFAGLIPLGYRPNGYSVTQYTVLQTSGGADAWGFYVRVNPAGDLSFRTDSGSTNLSTGQKLPINLSWLVA
ncbi:hypothetical protein VB1_CDS0020 [Arthrobacter phage Marchesin]|nr:hypothetical protein VB1_CDS0020 [Arthrobacter phage Marchesin]